MEARNRLTLALPVVLIIVGLLVPSLVASRSSSGPAAERAPARYAGLTAAEWAARGRRALERGRLDKALSYLKTAERVEPGTQYALELAGVRRARRRAAEIDRDRARFLEGPIIELNLRPDVTVANGHRVTIALPGESLWTLARRYAAALAGVARKDVGSAAVYAAWDRLTDLNGVRELEVGEAVSVPLPRGERAPAGVRRFEVSKDGTVRAVKPAGTSYTEIARETVERMLGRELARSGMEYPHSSEKTADERGWASYLAAASEMAESRGADFAQLLTAVDEELVLELPSPVGHFSH